MIKDLIQAERDQESDCALINDAIHLAEATIAAVAHSQETGEHWWAIRDRAILRLRDVRHNIIRRAREAKETLQEMTEAFFRANEMKAPPGYCATLQDIATTGLLYHLQYLIRTGEFQRAQGIRDALANRADRHSLVAVFEGVLAQSVFSGSERESAKRLARICQLAKEADAKLTGLWFRHDQPRKGIALDPAGEGTSNTAAADRANGSYCEFERPKGAELGAPDAPPIQAEGDITTTGTQDHLASAVAH